MIINLLTFDVADPCNLSLKILTMSLFRRRQQSLFTIDALSDAKDYQYGNASTCVRRARGSDAIVVAYRRTTGR